MSRATPDEIASAYAATLRGRVHRADRGAFAGEAGHYYFVSPSDFAGSGNRARRRSNELLAQITRRSRNPEVALCRINDAYFVKIGTPGMAAMTVEPPQRGQRGFQEFELVAHTHPLELADEYAGVADRATATDIETLNQIRDRWHQTRSLVVVCRGGRAISSQSFNADPRPVQVTTDVLRSLTEP